MLTNWAGVPNTAPRGEIPPSVIYSFYAGAVAFLGAVGWTVFRTREYPPENMEEFARERALRKGPMAAPHEILASLREMPRTMGQLAVVQFFSWFALFCMWIYTTGAVTSHHFHTTDPTTSAYNQGADWVGVLFSVYNGFAAAAAFLIPMLAARTSRKAAHIVSLVCGGAGLASMWLVSDPGLLVLSMVGVGIAWASILSMPYAILAGALPPKKMGVYMGIFNFFIVIPQIAAAGILGALMKHLLGGNPMNAIVLGGLSMFAAAGATFFVQDVDEVNR